MKNIMKNLALAVLLGLATYARSASACDPNAHFQLVSEWGHTVENISICDSAGNCLLTGGTLETAQVIDYYFTFVPGRTYYFRGRDNIYDRDFYTPFTVTTDFVLFDMIGDSYTVEFGNPLVAPPTYTITTSSSPSGGGTTSGGNTYSCGDTVTLNATPAPGYVFVTWTDANGSYGANPYTFTATANRTLVANFAAIASLNPLHWYDARTVVPELSDGISVSYWFDLGSGLNNLANDYDLNHVYPHLVADVRNGNPVVRWDHSSRSLIAQLALAPRGTHHPDTNYLGGLSSIDLFFVVASREPDNTESWGYKMMAASPLSPGSGGILMLFKGNNTGKFQLQCKRSNATTAISLIDANFTPVQNDFNIYHAKVTWNASMAYGLVTININGVNYQTDVHIPDPGISERNAWAQFPDYTSSSEDTAEMVMFGTDLSQANIDKMFGYLAWKWGLQGKLPANHVYKNAPPQ